MLIVVGQQPLLALRIQQRPVPLQCRPQRLKIINSKRPLLPLLQRLRSQIFTTTLSHRSSGTAVANLQQFLSDERLYNGQETHVFDQATLNVISAFQRQQSVTPVNGVFGSSEQAAANQIMSSHPDWATYLSNTNSYTNVDGSTVHSPSNSSNGIPAGASAQCGDGSYSFSPHFSQLPRGRRSQVQF